MPTRPGTRPRASWWPCRTCGAAAIPKVSSAALPARLPMAPPRCAGPAIWRTPTVAWAPTASPTKVSPSCSWPRRRREAPRRAPRRARSRMPEPLARPSTAMIPSPTASRPPWRGWMSGSTGPARAAPTGGGWGWAGRCSWPPKAAAGATTPTAGGRSAAAWRAEPFWRRGRPCWNGWIQLAWAWAGCAAMPPIRRDGCTTR